MAKTFTSISVFTPPTIAKLSAFARQQRRYVVVHDSITNQIVVMMDPKMDEGYEPVVV